MVSGTAYKIDITDSAQDRFQREILPYLHINFSIKRADQIEGNILKEIQLIANNPRRGTKEISLDNVSKGFRFVLIKESRNVELKIIYFVNESEKIISITDFFPVRMHPDKMLGV